MYCKNCGKEIGDSKFCPNCGKQVSGEGNIVISFPKTNFLVGLKEKVKNIGHQKLLTYVSVISAFLSIVIRVFNSEIETVIHGIALDDYYVVSESGRNMILVVLVLDAVFSVFLWRDAKNNQVAISKKQIITSVMLFLVSVIAVLLKVPAPY